LSAVESRGERATLRTASRPVDLAGSEASSPSIGTSNGELSHEIGGDGPRPLGLISALCTTLRDEDVLYCHWKSNEALDRSATGENDLDLLVGRRDARRFQEILYRFGFRPAVARPVDQLPGIFHAYGLDQESGKLVHVHAHFQLVLGDDMTKNFHLPIEEPYLGSSFQGPLFRTPSADFEFAVFVIRMILKHATWDAILMLQGSLSSSEQREYVDLSDRSDAQAVRRLVAEHLPVIDEDLWELCVSAARPGSSAWIRMRVARRLQRRLRAHSRRPLSADTGLRVWRRVKRLIARYVVPRRPRRKRLEGGGAVVAIVGGDGAGKSTAVAELQGWLSRSFVTTQAHLGKPPRSMISVVARGAWGIVRWIRRAEEPAAGSGGRTEGHRPAARLVWDLLTARDRYRLYRRIRRLSSNGGIVICDRYPLPQVRLMDGAGREPVGSGEGGRAARFLVARERRYYRQILYPDILLVLRVDPDIAVSRKLSEEGEEFVRPRSEEIWRADWSGTPAIIVDAGRPKAEVLREIRSVVWSRL